MSPRPNVSAERTEQIILAAMQVFAARGFADARMEDIAEAAGLSKGTLYLYFDSKDAVIEAILNAFITREMDAARAVIAAGGPVEDRLIAMSRVMAADLVEIEPFTPLYLEFLALALRKQPVHQTILDLFTGFMDILVPLIAEGIESGEFRGVDPNEAALTIGALFEGMILLQAYAPEKIDLEQHLETGMELIVKGLQAETGRRGSSRSGKFS